jgi:hypothetical protein
VRILIDREIAMSRLRSLTRDDGRPREYELKDLDILRAIAEECAQPDTQVNLFKVDGHSGDPPQEPLSDYKKATCLPPIISAA